MRTAPLPSMALVTPFSAAVAILLFNVCSCSGDDASQPASDPHDASVGNDADTSAADSSIPDSTSTSAVSLSFVGRVGSEPFRCTSTYSQLGATQVAANVLDFRLYVHDVRLVRKDGGETPVTLTQDGKWQYRNVALVDFEDRSGSCSNGTVDTNATITGTVPRGEGDYTAVRFRLGVPFDLNHGNAAAAPSPLNLSSLFWVWNAGYVFLRADSRTIPTDGGASSTFFFHLGSAGCQGDAQDGGVTGCAHPNVPDIELAPFDIATNKVAVDYAALVAESNLGGGGMGCMSSPDEPTCAPIFRHLGLDPATGQPVAGQTVFRAE